MLIQKNTFLILGKILTFISLKLTYKFIIERLTLLAFLFLMVFLQHKKLSCDLFQYLWYHHTVWCTGWEKTTALSQPVHLTATYRCDDTRGCVMQFWPPDDEHMCSKHVEAWNKRIVKQNVCASSWLITEINILRCTVSKTSKLSCVVKRYKLDKNKYLHLNHSPLYKNIVSELNLKLHFCIASVVEITSI